MRAGLSRLKETSMLLHIPQVLNAAQLQDIRKALNQGDWVDGKQSSGAQAAQAKQNRQLSTACTQFDALSGLVANALNKHPLFIAGVLPLHTLPPMFNRYENGGCYGNHTDNSLQANQQTGQKVRTDVSVTVFLNPPEEYEGGELVIEDHFGAQEIKLDAGDAIAYPSTSLHRVEPVTKGCRFASFLWIQSLIRHHGQRAMLFDLDMTIVKLRHQLGDTPEVLALTNHYHKLIQQWAET
ncbi:Fe2+-dependent dioxygenase [Limnobacter thiooxidans]|uniref:Fe2+-dependent dioxygenase n=2 Tax=Burkholderiaceae TaxID=119060 RepID=A0AA86JGT0_9BURK|nr:Fe2+-dependent dioxygenase [Limnobacter thiooxidans]